MKGLVVAVDWLAPEPPEPMLNPRGPHAIVAGVVATPATDQETVAVDVVEVIDNAAAGQGAAVAFRAVLSINSS